MVVLIHKYATNGKDIFKELETRLKLRALLVQKRNFKSDEFLDKMIF
jgi:hypothetical protein